MICLLLTNDDLLSGWLRNSAFTAVAAIPVAARSKTWVYGRSLAGNSGFESHRGYVCLSVVSVVCGQLQVSASG